MMTSEKINLICITPVKNESWILHRFLDTASLWADYIIVADQNSTDNSREIALKYSKVTLIENNSEHFNEPERQKLLIDKAREIPGKKILIALDADEILTANFLDSPEWKTICDASPGTILEFQWVNILPDMKSCWLVDERLFGFVDDGSDHSGIEIHSPRIPLSKNAPILKLNEIKVLHYQYTDWRRMESKHRWYQCWETLNNPEKSAIDIYRQYHHMNAISKKDILSLKYKWIHSYEKRGIDMTSVIVENNYWWDIEVLSLLIKHTSKTFKKQDIWGFDWNNLMNEIKNKRFVKTIEGQYEIQDPRNFIDKIIQKWLNLTQQKKVYKNYCIKLIDLFLKYILKY